jgi:hypothetical protein
MLPQAPPFAGRKAFYVMLIPLRHKYAQILVQRRVLVQETLGEKSRGKLVMQDSESIKNY